MTRHILTSRVVSYPRSRERSPNKNFSVALPTFVRVLLSPRIAFEAGLAHRTSSSTNASPRCPRKAPRTRPRARPSRPARPTRGSGARPRRRPRSWSTEEVPAEKRARQPEEATGSGKTIVQPPEEVKARLAERQKKQRERAEAARAEAARRQAEEQAAAKDAASRGRDATPAGDGERFLYNKEKKAPAVSAVSEKDRLIARQKELAARAPRRSKRPNARRRRPRWTRTRGSSPPPPRAALKAAAARRFRRAFKSASAPGPRGFKS